MNPNDIIQFLRLTLTGLEEGALLALIALALVLVYKATDVINFANGEFMMIGAYVGFQTLTWAQPIADSGFASVIAVIGMIAILVAVGVIVERTILRPLIGEPVISVIMVTIGLSNIIQGIVGIIWGKNPLTYPIPLVPSDELTRVALEGARRPYVISQEVLVIILVVLVIVLGLLTFFRQSKYGIAMRATADDQQAAMSMGISIKTMFAITWSLAAVTAGIAGMLIADTAGGANGNMPIVGLRAFPVIILGGLDSIGGAILSGFIIGLLEAYAGGYNPNPSLNIKDIVPYIILLIVLMFKPYGLFGQKRIERV
jgi:branched-chain amino acid transport system permease protein